MASLYLICPLLPVIPRLLRLRLRLLGLDRLDARQSAVGVRVHAHAGLALLHQEARVEHVLNGGAEASGVWKKIHYR